MVGDGVNDAPVPAATQVSIAMGGGTSLAQLNADMVLLGEHLPHLGCAVRMARRMLAVIRQNLWWALGYNLEGPAYRILMDDDERPAARPPEDSQES